MLYGHFCKAAGHFEAGADNYSVRA